MSVFLFSKLPSTHFLAAARKKINPWQNCKLRWFLRNPLAWIDLTNTFFCENTLTCQTAETACWVATAFWKWFRRPGFWCPAGWCNDGPLKVIFTKWSSDWLNESERFQKRARHLQTNTMIYHFHLEDPSWPSIPFSTLSHSFHKLKTDWHIDKPWCPCFFCLRSGVATTSRGRRLWGPRPPRGALDAGVAAVGAALPVVPAVRHRRCGVAGCQVRAGRWVLVGVVGVGVWLAIDSCLLLSWWVRGTQGT